MPRAMLEFESIFKDIKITDQKIYDPCFVRKNWCLESLKSLKLIDSFIETGNDNGRPGTYDKVYSQGQS